MALSHHRPPHRHRRGGGEWSGKLTVVDIAKKRNERKSEDDRRGAGVRGEGHDRPAGAEVVTITPAGHQAGVGRDTSRGVQRMGEKGTGVQQGECCFFLELSRMGFI